MLFYFFLKIVFLSKVHKLDLLLGYCENSFLFCQAVTHYLLVARISYRLLLTEPEFFSEHWDWSCFLDLVKKSLNLNLGHGSEYEEAIADIRWCGIQVLSVILKMSDRAIENFGVGAQEAASCLLRLVL